MTEPDAEDLRQLFRDDPAVGGTTDSDVDGLLAGSLSEDDAIAIASAAIDAPDLALEVRVAAAMETARREAESSAPAPIVDLGAQRKRRTRVLVTALVSAAAAAVVFLAVSTASGPPRLEEIEDGAIRTGVDKRIRPADGMSALPRDAFDLKWRGGPPGATYDLFVTTAALAPVYQALELPGAGHRISPKVLAEVRAGTTLLWRVVAVTEQGRRLHSTAFEVTVE